MTSQGQLAALSLDLKSFCLGHMLQPTGGSTDYKTGGNRHEEFWPIAGRRPFQGRGDERHINIKAIPVGQNSR